ncbi:VIT domain-containing protein [Paraferrimonas sedimenticola]|uniref:Marine proteobacterial sortase target protein n=1 Tax=Paraferrimonas sedimenticola TaxID=375674 RepID=A0AA37RYS8_9GAMM|nr:VIT domain-containing protein [Paraferrimonas sedimenticola]GLP97911.1 marine proteobacterial sortase target protein [Paraferrimonas sedimenticola]
MTGFIKQWLRALVLVYALGWLLVAWLMPSLAAHASVDGVQETPSLWLTPLAQGLPTDNDEFESLLLNTDVEMQVSGVVNRVTVTQQFRNTSDVWVHGRYQFPLPENAAVDRMQLRIGERLIEGEIQEKRQAEASFEQAKAEGKSASLVRQHKPNVFQTKVAHIAPGETVSVRIEYQQTTAFINGQFELRFPTVVAPRYHPSMLLAPSTRGDSTPSLGWNLSMDFAPGFELASLTSRYHDIEKQAKPNGGWTIQLAEQAVADKDFVLNWSPRLGEMPQAQLLRQRHEGKEYGLLMLFPASPELADRQRLAREVVFVLDVSGSMSGSSIEQAKAALIYGLNQLSAQDSFNVIAFSSGVQLFRQSSVEASAFELNAARRFVSGLQADGGTNMHLAFDAAMHLKSDGESLKQLVFLTDGAIGFEDSLLMKIRTQLGQSRLFTVGIGSAPNGYFMSRAAWVGRGSYRYIGAIDQVEAQMRALFDQLAYPALRDLRISWGNGQPVQSWPNPLPDLYFGMPLVTSFVIPPGVQQMLIEGTSMFGRWQQWVDVDAISLSQGQGINKLWAKDQIDSLALDWSLDQQARDNKTLELALAHGLVSSQTSLVAVDKTPRNIEEAWEQKIKPHMPAGWNMQTMPQTGLGSDLQLMLGLALVLLSGLWLRAGRRRFL